MLKNTDVMTFSTLLILIVIATLSYFALLKLQADVLEVQAQIACEPSALEKERQKAAIAKAEKEANKKFTEAFKVLRGHLNAP